MGNLVLMADTAITYPSVSITPEMLKPIVDSVVSNIGVILVPCVVVFGILLGVKLVPKIFSKFASM